MSEEKRKIDHSHVEALYDEAQQWHVNTGGETIHAKRMSGRFRTYKWMTASVWLIFFLGPYLRWGDRQAVLFDIPGRQYHIFGTTVVPQDFWMLSLVLLFLAILLAAVTTVAGRVYCGYFCFQTIWVDVFTWLEEKLEGNPAQRRKLDKAPWDLRKIRIKVIKHAIWILIGFLTGFSFVAWFTDAWELWPRFFSGEVDSAGYITVGMFTAGTYFLAGFLREQTCFWLCPYARLQGVMIDRQTVVPTYDYARGEPRGRIKKGQKEEERTTGDCIDCKQCVAVCPTGVDIRHGQQEGCITCGLCIDACDEVMDKIGRPRGLIRYASYDEVEGKDVKPLLKRPRVLVYGAIMIIAVIGIGIGFSSLAAVELKVLHERQPLFVRQSDGSIQNKYVLKVLNKTSKPAKVKVTAKGPEGLIMVGAEKMFTARPNYVSALTVFVKVPNRNLKQEVTPIVFRIESPDDPQLVSERESIFVGPKR